MDNRWKQLIFFLLFAGFIALFHQIRQETLLQKWMEQTRSRMDRAARRRRLGKDRRVSPARERLWQRVEQERYYCGLARHFPHMTAEWYVALQIMALCLVCLLTLLAGRPGRLLYTIPVAILAKKGAVFLARYREQKRTNDTLLKFLDFLGNYSLTAGELTGVFLQVSKFLDEPVKGVLETCCYEAQTTGDIKSALLAMADRVEHPKFKELVRTLEIASRHCSDLTGMVNGSRRSLNEYLRVSRERKGMLREAAVNMGLLLVMSVFSLMTVDRLIPVSIWTVLTGTWVGRLALMVVGVIFALFLGQIADSNQ